MVTELHSDGFASFEGGQREGPIDAVIWCTGYKWVVGNASKGGVASM